MYSGINNGVREFYDEAGEVIVTAPKPVMRPTDNLATSPPIVTPAPITETKV